jgi:hypothetical protein
MDGRSRFILAALMSAMMVCMVTLLTTLLNLGLPADFFEQWARAYFISWPVAGTTAFVVMPFAQRATRRIVTLFDGTG